MVDALRLVREWIAPSGRVIDLHPTSAVANIVVGDTVAGPIDPGGATQRHQAASDAIATAVRERLFAIEDSFEFTFSTYADSLDELNDHILQDWREARIDGATLERARSLIASTRGAICARERVAATRCVPVP